MKGEDVMRKLLGAKGARASLCCDFDAPSALEDQLSYAYHADVIIGLHGAGLIHAIFARRQVGLLELKTLYGYTSTFFLLVVDSRAGIHAQVDVKDYQLVNPPDKPAHVVNARQRGPRFISQKGPRFNKPIDQPLTERVIEALYRMTEMQRTISRDGDSDSSINDASGSIFYLKTKSDFITVVNQVDVASNHYLGPMASSLPSLCKASSVLQQHRVLLGASAKEISSHCNACIPFRRRA